MKAWRAAIAALLAGLANLVSTARAEPLTMALADYVYAAPALIAADQGYFAAEGLDLKIVHCGIGRVCLKQLLDGRAQYATAADTPITIASFTQPEFGIVATMSRFGGEHRMIVRADHGIRSAADLKGKRIGTLLGTSGHFFTDSFLLFSGIRLDEVTVVPLDPNDAVGPLLRGEVDAAGLFEPHGKMALQSLGDRARAFPTPAYFNVNFNLVSVPAAKGGRDEDLVKLLKALRRAVDLIHSDPQRARAIFASAAKVDAAVVAENWNDFVFRIELAQPLVTSLEAQARWALREKLVPAGATMPDYLDFIRVEPLRRVDPDAVQLLR